MRHTPGAWIVAIALSGCSMNPAANGPAAAPGAEARRVETNPEAPVCADGSWGDIDDPDASAHVRVMGSDITGDGTKARPYATVDGALEGELRRLGLDRSPAHAPEATCHTLNFDSTPTGAAIPAGKDISELYAAWGVHIDTFHTNWSLRGLGITFNSASPTGGDWDLGTPNQRYGGPGRGHAGATNDRPLGNVMIRAQHTQDRNGDGLVDDPNDHSAGAGFHFRFDSPQCVRDLDLLDIESGERELEIELFGASGARIASHGVRGLGDNSLERVALDTCGVTAIKLHLRGSGAIDNLQLCDAPASPPPASGDQLIQIAVGPGTFRTGLNLARGDTRLNVNVEGCSADETRLVPRTSSGAVARVVGHDLRLDGLRVDGGHQTLQVHDQGKLQLEDARVTRATTAAIVASGGATLNALRVDVLDPRANAEGVGIGIALSSGARAAVVDSRVLRASLAGIHLDNAELLLSGSEVSYTTSKSGALLGRGIHAQNGSQLNLIDSQFVGNENAAVFGLGLEWFLADGLIIDITGAGVWNPGTNRLIIDITGAGFTDATKGVGDGIVLIGDPLRRFHGVMSGNVIENSRRAAILVDSVEAVFDGNLATQNGLVAEGSSLFAQGKSDVSGADEPLVVQLPASQALRVNANAYTPMP